MRSEGAGSLMEHWPPVNDLRREIHSRNQLLIIMVFWHQQLVRYYLSLIAADRKRIGRSDMSHGLIQPFRIDRHLSHRQALANLEQFRIRQEVRRGRLAQEVDVEVGRHGERLTSYGREH